MDPTPEELREITDSADIWGATREWLGMSIPVFDALKAAVGEFKWPRQVAAIPLSAWDQARDEATVEKRVLNAEAARDATPTADNSHVEKKPLSALEQGQVGGLRRICRMIVGLPPSETEQMQAGALPPSQQAQEQEVKKPPTPPPIGKLIRVAQTLDQNDSGDVVLMATSEVRELIRKFIATNDNMEPHADEECSPAQLSCLKAKLAADTAPYADFSVFKPYGLRLGREMTFTAYAWVAEENNYVAREQSGPPSLYEWRRCFKLLGFGLRALGAVSRTKLERYEQKITQLVEEHGSDSWWLVYLADVKMRSERMERIRRRTEQAHVESMDIGQAYDPECPWDHCFAVATEDDKFWMEEVKYKWLSFNMLSRAKKERTTKEDTPAWDKGTTGDRASAPGGGTGHQKRKWDREQGEKTWGAEPSWQATPPWTGGKQPKTDGRSLDRHATQKCFAWNREIDGCEEPCPNSRIHACEVCGDKGHRSCQTSVCPEGGRQNRGGR